MGRSLELGRRSRDPEGIADYANKHNYADAPKTFKEHMAELKDLLSSLPVEENDAASSDGEKHERDVNEAREAVLETFDRGNNPDDERITSCRNRVFESNFGPKYNDEPNVFRTKETSVYRITGIDQIADIVNCGYVRPKEGKLKGGHENEIFWSVGGEKLNFIDKRPILETSVGTVKDGQIGALSLDDLTAVWILDSESGKRENKLNTIKGIKGLIGKDGQISVEELEEKIKNGISLADISATF
ncbi:hypothetical protein J6S37_02580 [Candidatus Saccharibacteria bacterium]|nr:hypothetical protein [Candidatus Saccharibacteria bacterium]